MKQRISKFVNPDVGLTPEQEEQCWDLYEKCGNVAEVARQLDTSYYHIRTALNRDPIRLQETRKGRVEAMAAVWEGKEVQAAKLGGELMDILDGMIRHIHACVAQGSEITDLTNTRAQPMTSDGEVLLDKNGQPMMPRMTPTQAYQWLLETKQLDQVAKWAYMAAKVGEGQRMIAHRSDGEGMSTTDPSRMTDSELMRMVDDLRAAGRELPAGVEDWYQRKLLARAPGT